MDRRSAIERVREYFATRTADVAAVYLFGSTSRDKARVDSDVDIGVLFRETPPATLEGQPYDIAANLGVSLGASVDIVVLNSAPADLRIRVLRYGELVMEHDRSSRIQFEVATRNEYFDLEPILNEYRRPRRTA